MTEFNRESRVASRRNWTEEGFEKALAHWADDHRRNGQANSEFIEVVAPREPISGGFSSEALRGAGCFAIADEVSGLLTVLDEILPGK